MTKNTTYLKPGETITSVSHDYVGNCIDSVFETFADDEVKEILKIAFHIGCDHGKAAAHKYLLGEIDYFKTNKQFEELKCKR